MNLCGGIANIEEPELLLEIPNEHFSMKPRRKSTPSSRRSSRKGVPTYVDTGRRTPTGTKTPSSRPSSRSRSRHSPSMNHASPHSLPSPTFLNPLSNPTFLNPLSKDDLRKPRPRQRPLCPPLHSLKIASGLIKKLEGGFNLVSSGLRPGRRPSLSWKTHNNLCFNL
jgi:hypothetical protein